MSPETFKSLLTGYFAGTLTGEEQKELSSLLHDPQYREQLENLFTENLADPDFKEPADPELLGLMYQHIQLKKQPAPVRRMFIDRFRWVAAAAVMLLATTAAYFLFIYQPRLSGITQTGGTLKDDIAAPTYTRAVLLLADGKEIILDNAANGQLSVQGNIKIVKSGDGQLMYHEDQALPAASSPQMNTLTIPAGSRPLQLTLSEGTKIWLNAASSITYPALFTGDERKVSVTGEAYFEVSPLPASPSGRQRLAEGDAGGGGGRVGKMPFIVRKGDMEVRVLGTHFNVNAYDDDPELKVTLLEGKVKVTESKIQDSKLLLPGEQAVLTLNSKLKTRNSVDLEQVMAWKEGYFDFSGADIQSVMRQLSRWYNIQVNYKGKITTNHFSGIINRSNNISGVLKMLQSTGGVNFKVETDSLAGYRGKIIVLP